MAHKTESERFLPENEELGTPVPPISCSIILGNFIVAFRYVWAETKKDQRSFIVGLFTVVLVVFAITLLQNTVGHAPVLFLKLAEDSIGEYDLVVTPKKTNPTQTSYFLNHTYIDKLILPEPLSRGSAPRWLFIADVLNDEDFSKNGSSILLVIDSTREREIGLGREWKHISLTGNKVHVSSALLRLIGVPPSAGKTLTIRFDLFSLLHTISGSSEPENEFVSKILSQILLQIYNVNTSTPNMGFSFGDILSQIRRFSPPFAEYVDSVGPEVIQDAIINFLKRRGITAESIQNGTGVNDATVALIRKSATYDLSCEVVDNVDLPKGKFPQSLGNVVVVEMELWNSIVRQVSLNFLQTFSLEAIQSLGFPIGNTTQQQIFDNLPAFNNVKQFLTNLDMREYCLTVIIMFRDRFTTFLKSKQDIDRDMIFFSNKIAELLGINYPADVACPLVNVLRVLYYMRLFLDQLLLVVQLFLVVLGSLLVYSLLLAEVEGKVYECGMLRALGMEQYTLIELLSIQSLLFSIPGICIGLFLAYLVFIPIGEFFAWYSAIPIDNALIPSACGIGILVGLVMPFTALVGPTKRALSKSLRDALDLYHSLSSDTNVTFQSLENLGLSPSQTWISIMAVVFGFIIYYLIPYSFIFFYWALFFDIFVFILAGMVIGLAILGVTVHPWAQILVINLIMWGPDRRQLMPIVKKNISGHGRRNSKTSILFTVCIAFIIFAGTVFVQQEQTLIAKAKIGIGADLVIQSFQATIPLDHQRMSSYLDKEMKRPGTIVLGYSFSTFGLDTVDYIRSVRASNVADWPRNRVLFFGVDRNFFDVTYDEYIVAKEISSEFSFPLTPHGQYDLVKSIYDSPSKSLNQFLNPNIFSVQTKPPNDLREIDASVTYGRPIDVIGSEAMRLPISVDTSTNIELSVELVVSRTGRFATNQNFHFLAALRSMASSVPGFLFSSYSQTAALTPMITSVDNYEWLLTVCRNASYLKDENLPPVKASRRALFIKVTPESNITQREDVLNSLRSFITDDRVIVSNTLDILSSTQSAVNILNIFFYVVSFMVIILCFFLLFVSFTTNVNENAWEFGVLRALGMTAFQVVRVYIYEALALVLASVLIGFFIGDIVSVTLGLQACLFSELPFVFEFPYILFFGVVFMSISVAVLGSYIPARTLLQKKIANALKNL